MICSKSKTFFKPVNTPCRFFGITTRYDLHIETNCNFKKVYPCEKHSFFHNFRRQNFSSRPILSHAVYKPKTESNNPPLFITHGLLGAKFNWNSIAKAVSKSTSRTVNPICIKMIEIHRPKLK